MRLASTSGLVALLVVLASVPQATATPSTTIVISEFRTRGTNGPSDQFVELYNLSSSPVAIGGWTFRRSDNLGTTSSLGVTVTTGVVLNPGCHYLLARGTYTGTVPRDQTFGLNIAENGGVALLDGNLTIIDQVGMSVGSAYKEGTPLPPMTANGDQAYERKPGGGSGSGQDTDDNTADFRLIIPSNPQNFSSGCVTIPTATESESWGAVKGLFR